MCIANSICLLAKYYIFKTRCIKEALNEQAFRLETVQFKNIEKYNAIRDGKLERQEKKWHNIKIDQNSTGNVTDVYIAEYMNNLIL